MRREHAFHLKMKFININFSHLFSLKFSVNEMKQVAKSYDATITQYIASVVVYAMMQESLHFAQQKKPIKLFIPINLRPYFDAVTLRNFSMYLKLYFIQISPNYPLMTLFRSQKLSLKSNSQQNNSFQDYQAMSH